MRNLRLRISNWIKIHKIAFGFLGMIFLLTLIVVPKKVNQAIKSPEKKYNTVTVKRGDLLRTVSASGKTDSTQAVQLKFAVSGKLAWVGIKEGDYVKKGQTIASLDRRELEKKLKKELNDYLNERWNFEEDYDSYHASGRDLEKLTLSDSVKRLLQQAQFDLNNSVLDVEIADLALELSTLTTPIEGIVTTIDTPYAGVHITPATAIFTVANPGKMEFIADVDESDVSSIRLGQTVKISLDAYPDQIFEGTIDQISFAAVGTKGGGTAFPVKIFLPENTDQRFKVGMNGDAEIILDSSRDTLIIPSNTIQTQNGQRVVRLVNGRDINEVPVTVGLESETESEITSGLTENQQVIVSEKEK